MFAGKHLAGATKSRRDLIGDEQHASPIAKLARPLKETRRLQQHAGGALDQRFNDKGGQLAAVLGKRLFQRRNRRLDPFGMKQKRRKKLVK